MRNPINKLFRKSRKYPIVYNDQGKSIRRVCMECFDNKLRPAQVIKKYQFNSNTVYKYWSEWKKLPYKFTARYASSKIFERHIPGFRKEALIPRLEELGITEDELQEILSQPWGFHKLMRRYWFCGDKTKSSVQADRMLEAIMTGIFLGSALDCTPDMIVADLISRGIVYRDKF